MGSGYRTFTAGEVLTASNVQNYLQDQVVMTFGGSAARSSAIGTANFEEGMTSYLTDTDKLEVYNGTNWVSVAPTSTQGLTLINTTSFSAVSSFSLPANTFTSTYDNYQLKVVFTPSTGNQINLRGRTSGTDNSTSNYNYVGIEASNAAAIGKFAALAQTSGYASYSETGSESTLDIYITSPNLAKSTLFSITANTLLSSNAAGLVQFIKTNFSATTVFDSMSLIPSSGTITGTYYVYGFNK
jgi:hypothetical protein